MKNQTKSPSIEGLLSHGFTFESPRFLSKPFAKSPTRSYHIKPISVELSLSLLEKFESLGLAIEAFNNLAVDSLSQKQIRICKDVIINASQERMTNSLFRIYQRYQLRLDNATLCQLLRVVWHMTAKPENIVAKMVSNRQPLRFEDIRTPTNFNATIEEISRRIIIA